MFGHITGVSRIRGLRREIARKFAQEGPWETLKGGTLRLVRETYKLVWSHQQNSHPFDIKYGTDTGGVIEAGALDIADDKVAHANRYQTAIVEVFVSILSELPIRYEEFMFIDLGSGKGRALLLASQFPFKEITGVELSPSLHRIACRNIQIYRDDFQRCRKIQSVCEDAAEYQIPPEKAVFYLFNPFDEQVMQMLAENIEESLHRVPREIHVIYLKPLHRDVFDRARFLKMARQSDRYVIYKGGPRDLS
jgi:SAM-dependent methyltransferase